MSGRMKNMKIASKLVVMISLLALVVMGILTGVTISRVARVTEKNGRAIADATASEYAALVKSQLELPLDEARALAGIFQGAATVDGLRMPRRKVNMLLKDFIERNTEFLGVYVAYEPDAFDGKDINFVNEWGHDGTGRFIPYWTRDEQGNGVLEALENYNQSGKGDFYQIPKQLGREAVIDPHLHPVVQGGEVLITSLVVPMFDEQEFIGIAGIDIELTKLQELVQNAKIGAYKSAYAQLFSASGIVVSGETAEQNGKMIDSVVEEKNLVEAVKRREHFELQMQSGVLKEQVLAIGVPVEIGDSGSKWIVNANIPISEMTAETRQLVRLLAAIAVGAVVIMIIAVVLISRSISVPLVSAVAFARKIAAGDLSGSIGSTDTRRGDEIGQLSRALAEMSESLQEIVSQIRDGSQQLASSAEEVSASSQQLASGAQNQASTLEETSASVEEMTASVEQVSDHAQSQAVSVEEASSNMEQMENSVQQVAEALEEVSGSSQEATEKAQRGAEAVTKAVEAIKSISVSSEQIAGIINVISDIADQTNLLALNASIEAARAGEHGRGFAVVADEVSKLAERSSTSTKEIEKLIGESGRSVEEGVEISQAALTSMEEIIAGARRTNEMVQSLAGDVEHQVAAIKEVAKATGSINEMSQSISAATEEQATNAKQVSKAIENVNDLTQQAASSAEQMTASTEELSTLAQQLQRLVEQFRIREDRSRMLSHSEAGQRNMDILEEQVFTHQTDVKLKKSDGTAA
jgi:methyl-accepting chemotaxis protein